MPFRLLALLVFSLLLSACGPTGPVRIGFIGGLSNRNADVGEAGKQGVILAIEEINRAGGIHGRRVELVAKDDEQSPVVAARVARELATEKVDAVIGPFTSGMAAVTVPELEAAGILTISPTITAMRFYGKDDLLVRINRTTRDNARDYAAELVRRGQQRVAVAYDLRNRTFTESWLEEFRSAMGALGHPLAAEVAYESQPDTDFSAVVTRMLAGEPDGLFFISGAIDVARLAQQARRQAPALPIGAAEWAATEQLLQLGGAVVDGLLIVQAYDRDDDTPAYAAFRDAFSKRFMHPPGYSAVLAHDAATVLLQALERRGDDESVKTAVLRHGPYDGLQGPIQFDANGDTPRRVYFTQIHNGSYVYHRPEEPLIR